MASSILQHHWQNDPTRVLQAWTDAYLILIRKPNKTGKEAGHYRPIGLQDQLGKLTFKTIIEPYQDHIYSHTMPYPQYGYTPGRSHRDALRRLFDHCHEVRTKCQAISGTLHDRYHGTAQRTLAGGVQITLDLAGAFDAMPRDRLVEGMHRIGLPHKLIEIVTEWHATAHYHMQHDGTDRIIHATQGVRQGCTVAPLLWLIYSHLISELLAEKIGREAATDLLSIFADDCHCSGIFCNQNELEDILLKVAALLRTLKEVGMTVSPAKSQAILKCKGIGAEQLRRRFVRQTPTGPVLRIRTASNCVDIPLVSSFIYLGAAVRYDHFEDRTLAHRLEIGKKNFGRLTKILRGRSALTRIHKLRIWQACVYTAITHLASVRLYGYCLWAGHLWYHADWCQKLNHRVAQWHIRLIVRDPVYVTNRTHQAVLEQWGLLAPI